MKKISLSPTLFLISELLILTPSVLFLIGVIKLGIYMNIFVAIIGPAAAGFVAYNYLERFGPGGILKTITKIIISYSILEIGLVIFFTLVGLI